MLDGGVAAAVVEVLVVEGVGNDAAIEVEHADVPILATVERIGFLADDGGTVFARIAITQNEFRMGNRADAVAQGHVKSRPWRLRGYRNGRTCRSLPSVWR